MTRHSGLAQTRTPAGFPAAGPGPNPLVFETAFSSNAGRGKLEWPGVARTDASRDVASVPPLTKQEPSKKSNDVKTSVSFESPPDTRTNLASLKAVLSHSCEFSGQRGSSRSARTPCVPVHQSRAEKSTVPHLECGRPTGSSNEKPATSLVLFAHSQSHLHLCKSDKGMGCARISCGSTSSLTHAHKKAHKECCFSVTLVLQSLRNRSAA